MERRQGSDSGTSQKQSEGLEAATKDGVHISSPNSDLIRDIVTYPSPEICRISSTIRKPDSLKTLVDEMIATMYAYNGVGLAAPQVGVHKRLIVVDHEQLGLKAPLVLINPKIEVLGNVTYQSEEGCLSVPGPTATITRNNVIEVTGKALHFVYDSPRIIPFKETYTSFAAAIFQHEVDHLEGVLFFEHLKPIARNLYVTKMKKQIKRGQAWRYQVATSL